jgi:hypothetical protein
MSKMMIKMLADMAGISPEQIVENVSAFQKMATSGIETLERIDTRLAAIEQKLGIEQTVENERQSDGEEIGIANAA